MTQICEVRLMESIQRRRRRGRKHRSKEEITKAGKGRWKERGKEGELMSSTAFYYSSSFADFNVLYRSLAQAVVLLLSHTGNAISVFNFPGPSLSTQS